MSVDLRDDVQLPQLVDQLNVLFNFFGVLSPYWKTTSSQMSSQWMPTIQVLPNALLDLYSAMFRITLPKPVQDTVTARVKSIKLLIGTLGQDVLRMDLSYIDPLAVMAGDEDAVKELLQVIVAVGKIVRKKQTRFAETQQSISNELDDESTRSSSVEPNSEYSDNADSDEELAGELSSSLSISNVQTRAITVFDKAGSRPSFRKRRIPELRKNGWLHDAQHSSILQSSALNSKKATRHKIRQAFSSNYSMTHPRHVYRRRYPINLMPRSHVSTTKLKRQYGKRLNLKSYRIARRWSLSNSWDSSLKPNAARDNTSDWITDNGEEDNEENFELSESSNEPIRIPLYFIPRNPRQEQPFAAALERLSLNVHPKRDTTPSLIERNNMFVSPKRRNRRIMVSMSNKNLFSENSESEEFTAAQDRMNLFLRPRRNNRKLETDLSEVLNKLSF
ncbi:hypothetical protein V1514DRAFT_319548 [Lipomyces japonicus]|uniref:uncharacterized protein n=1 Tax=Lipomyces japonicus TaxID=56871 RepID=UPI0034CD78C7